MREITIIDKTEDYESKSTMTTETNDEADDIYDVIVTLATNKYRDTDIKKIAEERWLNSGIHNYIRMIIREINEECDNI